MSSEDRLVGVHPAGELSRRARLFGALTELFPVRFEPVEDLRAAPGRAVVFGAGADALPEGPGEWLLFPHDEDVPPQAGMVALRRSPRLDARLHGWALRDRFAGARSLPADEADVIAAVDGRPVWVVHEAEGGRVAHEVAVTPSELGSEEPLRDRLDPGRFVELLPLVHWLRELTRPLGWQPPPPRAAFIVDDPNIHWRTYGHLDFRELVRHARTHGYHASIGTIPLDAWYAHGPTVRLFRTSRDMISLSIHGNNHVRRELGNPADATVARRSLLEARRRIGGFERRTGLDVSPVLIPPYEATSPTTLDATLDVGFEAATVTRPCSWLPLGPEHSPHTGEDGDDPLSGWGVAELTNRGLPLMIRRGYDEHDEIVLRAFLGQPILLYGHVSDLADGLGRLEEAANAVNALPSVRWTSLGEIATGNFEWRRAGGALHVRPYARRIRLELDPTVAELHLEPPRRGDGFAHGAHVAFDGEVVELPAGDRLVELPSGRDRPLPIEIRWRAPVEVAPESGRKHGFAAMPLARRTATEARDRLAPLVRSRRRRARGHEAA